jgi:glycosidase
MLSFYRDLIALRRASPALSVGNYRAFHQSGPTLLYERSTARDRMLVALNLSGDPQEIALPGHRWRPLLCTGAGRTEDVEGRLHLAADEGVILKIVED